MLTASPPVKRRGLAFKLSLMILTGTAVTAAFGYNYIHSRSRILRDVETNVESLTLAVVSRIETIIQAVQKDRCAYR